MWTPPRVGTARDGSDDATGRGALIGDAVVIVGGGRRGQTTRSSDGTDSVVQLGGGNRITVLGVTSLVAADFLFA